MSEFLSSVLRPQRARATGRPSWLTAIGLILIPLLIGGLLVWALWKPDERLDRIQAAVVNQDVPVQVDGKTMPLGRQLAGALVTSSGAQAAADSASPAASQAASPAASPAPVASGDAANVSGHDSTSNFTWVVTSGDDAAAGLADGRYATVVTIPAGFSAAATSVGTDPSNAQQATIDIATSDRSRPVDGAVAQAVTSTAVRVLSSQLTTAYLQNVFVGFDTLRGHLTDASDGASQLATGASGLSTGAASVADGAGQLASGAGQLASGASSASSGASKLSSGVGQLASGASSLASGLDKLAAGASSAAQQAQAGVPGAQGFAQGLHGLSSAIGGTGGLGDQLTSYQGGVATALTSLRHVAEVCAGTVTDTAHFPDAAAACAAMPTLLQAQANANDPTTLLGGAAGLAAAVNTGDPSDPARPALSASVAALAGAGDQLAAGVSSSATGLQQLAGAAQQSAAGAHQLASGARDAATGAASLASGTSSLSSGVGQVASGASSLASGASQLATGASDLGTGATSLADGLGTAAGQVPSYSTSQADRLAQVVANPVATTGTGTTSLFGGASVPFFLVVALWIGGLATFVVLGATAPSVVGSTRSSLRLAVTSFAPGALVGVVQGLALTAAMAKALDLTAGGWAAFAAIAALAGVAFAAVNQGLVAAFRGSGRFVAVVVAVVGLATAVVSTVPKLLDAVAGVLPVAPARAALQGVVTGDGVGGPVVLLVVWTVVGLALTTAAVARRRVVPAGRLARWVRAA
ncbi:MAG TPA: hypothetical protein VGC04_05675 [Cellulomonas sp.]